MGWLWVVGAVESLSCTLVNRSLDRSLGASILRVIERKMQV